MTIARDLDFYLDDTEHHEYGSLAEFFAAPVANGVVSIGYGSGYLDVMVEDRGCDTTIVLFHAATDPKHTTYPLFLGQGLIDGMSANAIFISDPVLQLGTGVGWFAGDRERPLQSDLPKVIEHIVSGFAKHEHLVFFGASCGGFASIFYAQQLPGSLAIPVNPQTDFLKYNPPAVEAYAEAAWPEHQLPDLPCATNLWPTDDQPRRNHVLYLQNLGDRYHVRQHLVPFLQEAGYQRGEVGIVFGEWGKGHRAPHVNVLRPLLQAAIDAKGQWAEVLKRVAEVDIPDEATILHRETQYLLSF